MTSRRVTVAVTATAVVLTVILFILASSADVFWALDRSTGVVTFLLLSATVVISLARSGSHAGVALVAIAFGTVHIVSTILGEHTSLGPLDAVVPFVAHYRATWVGAGVISGYLCVAVVLTSWPLRRLPRAWWIWIHRGIYLAWVLALAHALGAGSDARSPFYVGLDTAAVVAVVVALIATRWRRRVAPAASREVPS